MAKKQFKSESKRLLDLMINSIYTHKEIFLRELISNASDATDKLYYQSLADENVDFDREKFFIKLIPNKDARTLTVADAGIGMTREELEDNLGTIAKSGSFAFKNENEAEDVDIIGQFGVGFYSAFMVAKKVTVLTRKFGEETAWRWESEGADGYTIKEDTKEVPGTTITLELKEDTEEESYSEFLEEFRITELVKKYSDYIKYPIRMTVHKTRTVGEGEEKKTESYMEEETLNSMVPLWRKNKSEITEEEYKDFYLSKFYDYEAPARTIHTKADGLVSYTALLYFPKKPPYDFYTKDFKKGLQLYSNGVLIMDKCEDLLPDYFGFVKGLVDSADLSLNISREMLQHDRQLRTIAKSLKKKIKSELLAFLKEDREAFTAFYEYFGRPIKFGIYDSYGQEKDFLEDLLLFYSAKEKKLITLEEYANAMPEGQDSIYYACGETIAKIEQLPQKDAILDKGYDVLYFTEGVDEFNTKIMMNYKEKPFKSVSDSDVEEDKEAAEKAPEMFRFLSDAMKDSLSAVKPTTRLKNHPVCVTSAGPVSLEMEKVLSNSPGENNFKAERVLEINVNHKIFSRMETLFSEDPEKLKKLTRVLYNHALLIEGISVDDPLGFADDVCDLME